MYEKVSQKEVCCKIASIIQGEIGLLFQNPPRPPHNWWIFVKELVQFNQGKSSFILSWKARLICPQFHLPSAKMLTIPPVIFMKTFWRIKFFLSANCNIYLFTKINGFRMSYLSWRLMRWSLRFLCHSFSIHSRGSVFILQNFYSSCKFSWRLQELFMTHIKNVSIWWWTRILVEISMEETSQHYS